MIGSEQPVQLNPPIPVITPLGHALAYFIWGVDRLVWYGCFQDDTGENWWFLNNHIRLCPSMSDGQFSSTPIFTSPEMKKFLAPHLKRHQPKKVRK